MYARVARFEGGEAESIRTTVDSIKGQADQGPPEGVPAKGFMFLAAPEDGRVLVISLFESMEDLRAGDEALNRMSPEDSGPGMGQRSSVETYEVAFEGRT